MEGPREVGLSLILVIEVAIMFVLSPMAATRWLAPPVMDLSRLGLAAAAVILLTRNRLVSIVIIGTFLASVGLAVGLRSSAGATATVLERVGASTAFDLAIAVAVANVAFGPGKVSVHRIMGAFILYLSIALVFANAYRVAALLLHPSFSGQDSAASHFFSESLYFSLTTLTTTGYGDIVPLHPFVRSLANLEAVIGQLFPATLLARLVTLHSVDRPGKPGDAPWTRSPADGEREG